MAGGMEDLVFKRKSNKRLLLKPEKVYMLVLSLLCISRYAMEAFFKCSLFI